MNMTQRIFKSTIIGASIVSFGLLSAVSAALAGSTMPPGYTLSQKQLKGKFCYRHNNEVNLYCYSSRLTPSMMKKGDSMMKGSGSMMKKDDSMMMKDDSMMKSSGSMMKKDDSMMMKKDDSMMKDK
jgi:hypothetical protein